MNAAPTPCLRDVYERHRSLKAMSGTNRSSLLSFRFEVLGDVAEVRMLRFLGSLTLACPIVLGGLEQTVQRQPLAVFARLGLTPQEVAAVDKGRPVAKVLSWGEPSEVYVFGAVHITGSPNTYLKSARDIKRLAAAKGYLGIGELPAPSLDPADLTAR